MTKVITTQIGSDGVLTLNVPLAKDNANKMVRVTVETLAEEESPMEREEWLRFIAETGGSIPDPSFMRHPQGEYEDRDPLP